MPVKNILSGQNIYDKTLEAAKHHRSNPTPEEKLLWKYIRNNQLNGLKFRRQQIIDGYIVDFYCHQCALIIEIDGIIHDSPEQIIHDQEREIALKERGFSILHFSNNRINHNLESILEEINHFCNTILNNSGSVSENTNLSPNPPLHFGEGFPGSIHFDKTGVGVRYK